jgi:hypothetical protein
MFITPRRGLSPAGHQERIHETYEYEHKRFPRNCAIRYGALGLTLLLACPALAYKGEKLAKDAKISIAEARAIALKAHPGKITDEELERESGGTGLRYSFDIKSGSTTQEVGVDARTGRVLENATEGKNPD